MKAVRKVVVFIDHCESKRPRSHMTPVGWVDRYFVRIQPGGTMIEVDRAFFDEVYTRMSEGFGDAIRAELVLP